MEKYNFNGLDKDAIASNYFIFNVDWKQWMKRNVIMDIGQVGDAGNAAIKLHKEQPNNMISLWKNLSDDTITI